MADAPATRRSGIRPPGLLEFRGVWARNAGRNTRSVEDLSFAVPEGRCVPIWGLPGSGKTTVARLAAGMADPDRGRVLYRGRPLASMRAEERAALRRREILAMFSLPATQPEWTVRENVSMQQLVDGRGEELSLRRAEQALRALGIAQLASERAEVLSLLEARLVELARAWAMGASLIVADDVTLGLPRRRAEILIDHLFGLVEAGASVLLLTSRTSETCLGDEILELEDGRLLRQSWDEEEI